MHIGNLWLFTTLLGVSAFPNPQRENFSTQGPECSESFSINSRMNNSGLKGGKRGKKGQKVLFFVFKQSLWKNETWRFVQILSIVRAWPEKNLKKSSSTHGLCGASSQPPNFGLFLKCFFSSFVEYIDYFWKLHDQICWSLPQGRFSSKKIKISSMSHLKHFFMENKAKKIEK